MNIYNSWFIVFNNQDKFVQVVQETAIYIYSKRFYIINATNVVVVHNSTSVNFEGLYVYLTHIQLSRSRYR